MRFHANNARHVGDGTVFTLAGIDTSFCPRENLMIRHVVLVTLLALAGALTEQDVKETVRLTVMGPEAEAPVVITDGPILERANVFVGTFIREPTHTPDLSRRRYRLTFDVQGMYGVKYEAYVVHYVKGERENEGVIYLPGPAAAEYPRNISTILRDGHDGLWHRADPEWAQALNAILPAHGFAGERQQ